MKHKNKRLPLIISVLVVALLLLVSGFIYWFNQPSGFYSFRYQVKAIHLPKIQKYLEETISARFHYGWKHYDGEHIAFDYPEDWRLKDGEEFLSVVDPKDCYKTSSRPPEICGRGVGFALVSVRSDQTAKDYVEGIEMARKEEAIEYQSLYEEFKKTSKAYDYFDYQKLFPELISRDNYKNRYGSEFVIFERPSLSNSQIKTKEYAISGSNVLYSGSASIKGINDWSIESEILKTVRLK